jgi:hypothetical protein
VEELIQLINNSGFPIVVALYSLVRLETTIKANTEAIVKMSAVMGGNKNE